MLEVKHFGRFISISLRRATLFTSLIDIAVAVLFWVLYHITLCTCIMALTISFSCTVTGVSTYPLVYPTTAAESNWAGDVTRTEKRTPPQLISHHNFSISYSFGGERKQLHIFQDGETGNKATQSQLNLCAVTPYDGRSSGSRMFDCALSLLSSATSDVNLSHMVPLSDTISMVQYGGFMQHTLSQADSDVRTPTGCSMGKNAEINCHSKFQVEGEDCLDGNSQSLPSYWP